VKHETMKLAHLFLPFDLTFGVTKKSPKVFKTLETVVAFAPKSRNYVNCVLSQSKSFCVVYSLTFVSFHRQNGEKYFK
jgi:hypothetical protein